MSDAAVAVRSGEEIDASRLASWLDADSCEVTQFPGGYSNLTYLIRADGREYVLRRPPVGVQIATAHDMSREYRVLTALNGTLAPKAIAYCEDSSVIGAPFYLMERVRGIILRRSAPAGFDAAAASRALIDNLARIHAVDWKVAGLNGFGKPEGYVRRQIEGWAKRYENAATGDIAEMAMLANWLAAERPGDSGECLIHNDYKYDNVVLSDADTPAVVATLDWEMATIGDPLMDLGTTLAYWVQADDPDEWRAVAFCPTALPGSLTRAELALRYADLTGRDVSNVRYYYIYGLFKIAVIVQQIYRRYVDGKSRDARFAGLEDLVRAAARVAAAAV